MGVSNALMPVSEEAKMTLSTFLGVEIIIYREDAWAGFEEWEGFVT